MDAARHSPYAAAFHEGFYAMPPYFYGEHHRQPEMAWNEQTRWLPVGQLYSQHQQLGPAPVVAVPQTCAVAPSGAQCHDGADNRLRRPRDEHLIRPMCGPVFYTFCERPPLEFHYRRAANACVPTSDVDSADICNRGANRSPLSTTAWTAASLQTGQPRNASTGLSSQVVPGALVVP
ncbi:hypothetical protein HPB50_029586 [Hyalomma asiaticum]|nr:hypothetical protein HPB50_029586 [Hyalomma asiaticum]